MSKSHQIIFMSSVRNHKPKCKVLNVHICLQSYAPCNHKDIWCSDLRKTEIKKCKKCSTNVHFKCCFYLNHFILTSISILWWRRRILPFFMPLLCEIWREHLLKFLQSFEGRCHLFTAARDQNPELSCGNTFNLVGGNLTNKPLWLAGRLNGKQSVFQWL